MAGLVRWHDRDRYQTALFAPAARREGLFALYAFNYEVARIRETVREPMLGRIRLQWWREAIAAAYEGDAVRRHDAVEALTATIRGGAPMRAHFDRLIDAREIDLEDASPATLAALEEYCEGSSASLVYLAAELLGVPGGALLTAARDMGIGYGLAGLLRAMPFHVAAGRCTIPDEIAAAHCLDRRDYWATRPSPALRAAVAALAAAAEGRLAASRRASQAVPRPALPALLPAVVASRFLAHLARAGYNPFDPALAPADPLQSWRLAAAALRGRF